MFNATLTLPAGISHAFSAAGISSRRHHRRFRRPMATLSSFKINASFSQTAQPPPPPPLDYLKPSANFYEVLSVRETATPAEIKTAYRNLAKRFHPDTVSSKGTDGRDFIEINRAYATLSDPTARARYDASICAGRRIKFSPIKSAGFSRGFQTRRWETDQCW